MTQTPLYPLRFDPIFQSRLWGGRRLGDWLATALPGSGPIGEAWILSDRDAFPSRVAAGPLAGATIAELIAHSAESILGELASRFDRFPLLLKFLDVERMLSVQVHPQDGQTALIPAGEAGKTEAWVVLAAEASGRIYAGLQPGSTAADLRALSVQTVARHLAGFQAETGQAVLIEAGTVHAVGGGVVLFEVQQNSDVTFRLYDWDHIDPATGHGRPLQVNEALACVAWGQGPVRPTVPVIESREPAIRERLIVCAHFVMWRLHGAAPFRVGVDGLPRILVCIAGRGAIDHGGARHALGRGAVMLLPASVGACRFRPDGPTTLLEIGVAVPP